MKKLTIALLVSSMTACVPVDDDEISSQVRDTSLEQIANDNEAVSSFLRIAKAQDPSVKDAYLSVDDDGVKTLNVIRDSDDDSVESMALALGGVAAGALAGSMLTQSYIANRNRAPSHQMSNDSYKRKKEEQTSGYSSAVFSAAHNQALLSRRSASSSGSSSGSKPAFRSSSGARSSSYGSSGG